MNELIKITENNGKQAISARELYKFLSNDFASPIETTSSSLDCYLKEYLVNLPLNYSRIVLSILIPFFYFITAFIYYLLFYLKTYYSFMKE